MFLNAITRKTDPDPDSFPWSVPVFRWLERLEFSAPVTFLVGENGSGKSTLLEGLAAGMEALVAAGADIDRDESLAALSRGATWRSTTGRERAPPSRAPSPRDWAFPSPPTRIPP